ncbi:6-bladed beta-propeller [Neolewinella lacunae]|uniref:6-bladed beta-propeller n=1 Tax=Neolewinella lacunae TaxID=1517758 RepID=A0A923T5U9_9BACT|nr:6-bladed beta-propeller [Neolewinella lacunae]MBC6992710.1 6-bladed beta-propeller [Neolewinella lacunae]MDN3635954.1 6-bladed beta-propeller [Neolewinella lacunae]
MTRKNHSWKNATFLVLLMTLLACCQKVDSNPGTSEAEVFSPEQFEPLDFQEMFDIERYVPLLSVEGKDYLYSINKLRFYDDDIYILQDQLDRTIFKFSSKGELLESVEGTTSIEKKFYAVDDIVLHNNEVIIPDRLQSQIIFYDQSLNYLRHIDTNFPNGLVNIAFLPSGRIIARPVIENGEPSSLYLNTLQNPAVFKPVEGFKGIAHTPAARYRLSTYETFFHSSSPDAVLYADVRRGCIWEISEEGVKEKYLVQLPAAYLFSEEEMETMEHMSAEEILTFGMKFKGEKFTNFDYIFENNEFLIVSFLMPLRRRFIIKNKRTGRTIYRVIRFDNTGPNNIDQSLPLKYLVGITDEGQLVFYHDAEAFKLRAEALRASHPPGHQFTPKEARFLAAADQVTEYCSVVLAFVSVKL